jgi:hypothetical protein
VTDTNTSLPTTTATSAAVIPHRGGARRVSQSESEAQLAHAAAAVAALASSGIGMGGNRKDKEKGASKPRPRAAAAAVAPGVTQPAPFHFSTDERALLRRNSKASVTTAEDEDEAEEPHAAQPAPPRTTGAATAKLGTTASKHTVPVSNITPIDVHHRDLHYLKVVQPKGGLPTEPAPASVADSAAIQSSANAEETMRPSAPALAPVTHSALGPAPASDISEPAWEAPRTQPMRATTPGRSTRKAAPLRSAGKPLSQAQDVSMISSASHAPYDMPVSGVAPARPAPPTVPQPFHLRTEERSLLAAQKAAEALAAAPSTAASSFSAAVSHHTVAPGAPELAVERRAAERAQLELARARRAAEAEEAALRAAEARAEAAAAEVRRLRAAMVVKARPVPASSASAASATTASTAVTAAVPQPAPAAVTAPAPHAAKAMESSLSNTTGPSSAAPGVVPGKLKTTIPHSPHLLTKLRSTRSVSAAGDENTGGVLGANQAKTPRQPAQSE